MCFALLNTAFKCAFLHAVCIPLQIGATVQPLRCRDSRDSMSSFSFAGCSLQCKSMDAFSTPGLAVGNALLVSPAKIAMVHTEFIAGQVTGNPLALYHRTGMRRRVGDSENRIALCGVPLDHVLRMSPAWNLWHQRSLDPVWGFSLYTTWAPAGGFRLLGCEPDSRWCCSFARSSVDRYLKRFVARHMSAFNASASSWGLDWRAGWREWIAQFGEFNVRWNFRHSHSLRRVCLGRERAACPIHRQQFCKALGKPPRMWSCPSFFRQHRLGPTQKRTMVWWPSNKYQQCGTWTTYEPIINAFQSSGCFCSCMRAVWSTSTLQLPKTLELKNISGAKTRKRGTQNSFKRSPKQSWGCVLHWALNHVLGRRPNLFWIGAMVIPLAFSSLHGVLGRVCAVTF